MSGWTSLTSADLLVSLRVPIGWDALAVDESTLQLQGGAEADDYRPTVTLEAGRPEESGRDWFEAFTSSVVPELAAEVPGFDLIGTSRSTLSSRNAQVFAVHARRDDPAGPLPPTSQVQAWVWAGSHRMLAISASTTTEREAVDLPVFDEIIASIRLLPPRPSEASELS
ncbi:hypothetical protein [Nocardioides sp.]|uniref:hypothetical protein n=1 Tax=Nocardioides sp. TaxID=35761 RepID=UPI0035687B44